MGSFAFKELPLDGAGLREWCEDLWVEKDRLLAAMMQERQVCARGTNGKDTVLDVKEVKARGSAEKKDVMPNGAVVKMNGIIGHG